MRWASLYSSPTVSSDCSALTVQSVQMAYGHFQPYAFRSAKKSGRCLFSVASLFHFPGPHSFMGFKVHCVLCSGSCLFEYLLLQVFFFFLKIPFLYFWKKSRSTPTVSTVYRDIHASGFIDFRALRKPPSLSTCPAH